MNKYKLNVIAIYTVKVLSFVECQISLISCYFKITKYNVQRNTKSPYYDSSHDNWHPRIKVLSQYIKLMLLVRNVSWKGQHFYYHKPLVKLKLIHQTFIYLSDTYYYRFSIIFRLFSQIISLQCRIKIYGFLKHHTIGTE